ncbi:hypothetical protein BC628DRAFT_1313846, partial [Trametes gibbosa]
DSKFPGQRVAGLPPSPCRENPGQVFPQSDPEAATAESVPGTGGGDVLGNPYVLDDAFARLDGALSDVIEKIRGEVRCVGGSAGEDALLRKFGAWRGELTQIRSGAQAKGARGGGENGGGVGDQQEGGLFTD